MYLHPALIREVAAERHADDLRRAARGRRYRNHPVQLQARRPARNRAGPLWRLRLARVS